ncbi:MAG: GreA/GreB family elongation factor [Microthrixaceae bacterium]
MAASNSPTGSNAREHGDLKENAEYHSAKEEKSKMEARIAQIFGILENCTIVDASGSDKVMVGSIVTLRYDDEDDDEAERYLIGSIEEQTDGVNVISPNSPLGSALTGVAIGESVTYETPTGATLTVIVMGIE